MSCTFSLSILIPILLILISLVKEGKGEEDKIILRNEGSSLCVHIIGKNITVLDCLWRKANDNLTNKGSSSTLNHELLSIHPYKDDSTSYNTSKDMEDEGKSKTIVSLEVKPSPPTRKEVGNETLSYFIIRIRRQFCLSGSGETFRYGKCGDKPTRFLIRPAENIPTNGASGFTIQSLDGLLCMTWNYTTALGPKLARKPCFNNNKLNSSGIIGESDHQVWQFCSPTGNCSLSPVSMHLKPYHPKPYHRKHGEKDSGSSTKGLGTKSMILGIGSLILLLGIHYN